MRILAADIGGTHSRFALFAAKPDSLELEHCLWVPTREYDSFAAMLTGLADAGLSDVRGADKAVWAVPGPVQRGGTYCQPPNIFWDIDVARDRLPGMETVMVNDFVAQAFGCVTGAVADAEALQAGSPVEQGNLAVIGAGTGLGHCALLRTAAGSRAVPSEAGHLAFAFRDGEERDFERFALSLVNAGYLDVEDVVSGSGLALVHRWLTNEDLTPPEVSEVIMPGCATVSWFARFYGRAARHYALSVLPFGGLYVSGGVAARKPMLVRAPEFLEEFRDLPDYRAMLSSIPIFLNVNQDCGLHGAARYGLEGAGDLSERAK